MMRHFRFVACIALPLIARFASAVSIDTSGVELAPEVTIKGMVISADRQESPLSAVMVTVSGEHLKSSTSGLTDSLGRFRIDHVPVDDVTVAARKPGYLPMMFGAIRPGATGITIPLSVTQPPPDIVIRLTASSTIGGTILDESGQPSAGLRVSAVRRRSDGSFDTRVSNSVTDSLGNYRLADLAPGPYLLAASRKRDLLPPPQVRTVSQNDSMLAALAQGLRPTLAAEETGGSSFDYAAIIYYPGVLNESGSQLIVLDTAESRDRTDFKLPPNRSVQVGGNATMPTGIRHVRVTLFPTEGKSVLSGSPRSTTTTEYGQFAFESVTAGTYDLEARSYASEGSQTWWGQLTIRVGGQAVSDLRIDMRPTLELHGEVRGAISATSNNSFEVVLSNSLLDRATRAALSASPEGLALRGSLNKDSTFEIHGISPGTYRLSVTSSRPDLAVLSAIAEGNDLLDVPLLVSPDTSTLPHVTIEVSSLLSSLSGMIVGTQDIAISRYSVLIFPSSPTLWPTAMRRIRTTHPNPQGRYQFEDVPAGEYYVGLLADLNDEDLGNPDFFEAVRRLAVLVTVSPGRRTTLDVKVGVGKWD